jgi:putative membrane protein
MVRSILPDLAVLASLALCGPAAAKPAQAFIREAIKGDNSEVELGRMAAQHATRPDVRAFGDTLAQDHGRARQQAVAVAGKLGVTPPRDVMPEAAKERQKLQGLSGAAFDREFVSYMVKDHKKDIQAFEAQAHETGPTADLATQTLPTLRKHLQTAERLQK